MTEPYSFETLLGQAKIGNERAMVVLYRGVQPGVIRYLRAREPRVAEDLASEVWMGVLAGLGTFEGDEVAFRSWVFTIVHRRVADHRRKTGRRRTDPAPDEVLERPGPDNSADHVEHLAAQEAVQALIAGLPPDQAEVILLRVIADLPVADVAAITGKNEGHVRVLQHRALQRLARQLAPEPATNRQRVTR